MGMKPIHGLLIALLLVTLPALGQAQPPSLDETVTTMQAKLKLTPDQVAAVTPIMEKYASKRDQLYQGMQDASADHGSIRSQMKQLKIDENQELSQVLSVDQMNQWKAMQVQGKHRHSHEGVSEPASGQASAQQ